MTGERDLLRSLRRKTWTRWTRKNQTQARITTSKLLAAVRKTVFKLCSKRDSAAASKWPAIDSCAASGGGHPGAGHIRQCVCAMGLRGVFF